MSALTSRPTWALAMPSDVRQGSVLSAPTLTVALLFVLATLATAKAQNAIANPPSASPLESAASAHPYAAYVAEAARRFGIPEAWIWAVMRVESAGDARAISRAGAMGLMQVMPGTYADLRARHALGPDPYDIRDNILAGAAYLREMHDRYGATGMLAAYNAGPGRWEDHLTRGRPLPAETVTYMARLRTAIGSSSTAVATLAPPIDRHAWRRATLFVTLESDADVGALASASQQTERNSDDASSAPKPVSPDQTADPSAAPGDTLFAVRRPL